MNVCLDIQSTLARRSGVGRYTYELARHLPSALGSSDVLSLFYFDFSRKGMDFSVPRAREKAVRWLPGRFVQKAWKTVGWPPYNWFAGRADVYHFPNFIRPPLRRGRSVVTIHDVSFLRHPETLEARNLAYLRKCIRNTLDTADAVITDCVTIADEIHERFGTPRERLHPILLGIPADWPAPPAATVEAFRATRGLHRPYLLHVGTLEPRKNHAFLLEVFDRLSDFDGDLVFSGSRGWKDQPILDRIARSPFRDRIRLLDFVPDSELPSLYAGAELFLFPSLYEGFGFPPLEAMRCGVPVLASPGGSLREVVGTGAEILEIDDPDRWVAAIRRLLSDSSVRSERIAAGQACADQYAWSRTASQTVDLYRKLAG